MWRTRNRKNIDGVVDVGANSDLHKSFDIVTKFVDDYCSYGYDAFERRNSSEYLLEKKDRLVASEMERYYQLAKNTLADNKNLFEMIVESLMEKKTLTCRDIAAIKDKLI